MSFISTHDDNNDDVDMTDILSYLQVTQPALFEKQADEGDDENDKKIEIFRPSLHKLTRLVLENHEKILTDIIKVKQNSKLSHHIQMQYIVDKLHQQFLTLKAYALLDVNDKQRDYKRFVIQEARHIVLHDDILALQPCKTNRADDTLMTAESFKQLYDTVEPTAVVVKHKVKPCIIRQ